MKAELGMNVKIPDKRKAAGAVAKAQPAGAGGRSAATSGKTARASSLSTVSPPSPAASRARPNTHKARQRERKKKQKAAAVAAVAAAAAAPAAPVDDAPSTNKNTVKNKRRRAKEKEARQHKAELKRSAPAVVPPVLAASSLIDPSVKNSTKPPSSSLTPASLRPARDERVATQQLSEANSARFSSLSALFENGKWWTHPPATSAPSSSSSSASSSSHAILLDAATQQRLTASKTRAESVLSAYTASVTQGGGGPMDREDARWLSQVMSGGTLSDRVAGMQLLMQDRCLGRLDLLQRLLSMAQKKNRRESTLAMDALRDLFLTELLPPNRPLSFFSHQRALLAGEDVDDAVLMYWLFEDAVKRAYTAYLTVLETRLHDPMSYIKKAAINTLFSLLSALPERERAVLALLVNKLGDPDKRIASRIVYLLSELIAVHPAMTAAVVREVEAFLHRSGLSERGQYYAVIFLNQIKFRAGENAALARRMIGAYFDVFALEVRRTEAVNSRLLGGILTGINRALPFAKEGGDVPLKDAQIDLLFSLTHSAAFHTAVQAMTLLWQIVADDVGSPLAGRYYRALYELVRAEGVGVGGKVGLFLNLLYRSMKGDDSEVRVAAFVKRLLQAALGRSAAFVCGCLYLVSEVSKKHGGLRILTQRGDWKAGDDDEEHFVDVDDEEDVDAVRNVEVTNPSAAADERKVDDDDGDDDSSAADSESQRHASSGPRAMNGSSHVNGKSSSPSSSSRASVHAYDPSKREPLYARANLSALWELTVLVQHYHPSVQSWARLLLSSTPIHYDGDPLTDFTLSAFLDRFVFKNPKKASAQPARVARSHLQRRPAHTAPALPVTSAGFLAKKAEDVREDEQFYWRYFKEKERREATGLSRKKKAKAEREEHADDEEAIDAFADRIMEQELLKATNPDLDDEDDVLEALREDRTKRTDDADEEDQSSGEEGLQLGEGPVAEDDLNGKREVSEGEEDDEEAVAEAEAAMALDDDEDDDEDDFPMPTFSDEDDEEEEADVEESHRAQKRKRVDGIQGRAVGLGSGSVFASAEEFADLLIDGVDSTELSRKEAERAFTHDRLGGGGRRRGGRKRRR